MSRGLVVGQELAADRHAIGCQGAEMDLKALPRRGRELADFRLQHGIGEAFRKQAALREAQPAFRGSHGDDGHGYLLFDMTAVIINTRLAMSSVID
ncbi:hypothetical protein QA640_21690 [Bradyrhizobium sp. CB82]|uniref:hypothetical protein n=1 Tax=Bradyrhizobium sp. CB82 TaxID=3039159 RepID=UPI0024B1CACE|nr:hypothetical protein [Bradyrhizobium sp. CB82]WFU44836.1 hypothetical protein QA640_21690 [Bradyrhizobium sp. CB82]